MEMRKILVATILSMSCVISSAMAKGISCEFDSNPTVLAVVNAYIGSNHGEAAFNAFVLQLQGLGFSPIRAFEVAMDSDLQTGPLATDVRLCASSTGDEGINIDESTRCARRCM